MSVFETHMWWMKYIERARPVRQKSMLINTENPNKAPDYVLPDPIMEMYISFAAPTRPEFDMSDACYKNFYVSTREIAEFLRMTRVAVWKRIRSGKLKAKMIGGSYMVSLYDLEKHLDHAINIYDFVDIRERRELANMRQACYNACTT